MMIGNDFLPGFFWIPVTSDESGAWTSYWMRLEAGARSREHRHEATELVMILGGPWRSSRSSNNLRQLADANFA
jgi:hypothetical protein